MSSICRTCMSQKEEMLSIFNEDQSPSIIDMIMAISSIEFLPNDTLPPQMCITCFETLGTAYYFRKQVISCNNALQKEAQSSKLFPLQVNPAEKEIKQERGDFYNEPDKFVSTVDSDEKISTENSESNVNESCNDLEESSTDGIKEVDPDSYFEETWIKTEEIDVEENGVQLEDNSGITPEQIMIKNEADHDGFCSEDLPPTDWSETSEDVRHHSIKDDGEFNKESRKCEGTVSPKGGKSYECTFCNKLFNRKGAFAAHVNTHTHPKKYTRRHTPDRPFKCQHCDASFTRISNLNVHTRKHTGETTPKPHKCGVCGKTFTWASHLIPHMRSHTHERPFKCQLCNAEFTESYSLKKHLRKHTGEAIPKPHKCEVCAKSFLGACELKIHMRSHTGEKPFKCKHCNSTFTTIGNLNKHMRSHTGEATPKPHKCEVCGKAFSWVSQLKTHIRSHTNERPFKCQQCDADFTQASHLNQHVRMHTGEATTSSKS